MTRFSRVSFSFSTFFDEVVRDERTLLERTTHAT